MGYNSPVNDKQVSAVVGGSIVFALFGGLLLLGLAQAITFAFMGHIDGGDDGWGLYWILFTIISGIIGAFLSGKWARKRYPDFQP